MKTAKNEFLDLAKAMDAEDQKRVLSRIRKKYQRKVLSGKVDDIEVIALQLEIEDEDLKAWSKNLERIRKKDGKNEKSKTKSDK